MKEKIQFFVGLFVFLAFVVAVNYARADQDYLPAGASANATRACNFKSQNTQTVSVSGTTAPTSTASAVGVVRVICTSDSHMHQAAVPVATTSMLFLTAKVPEYFLSAGEKFAFIQDTASGTCYVSECK